MLNNNIVNNILNEDELKVQKNYCQVKYYLIKKLMFVKL